MMWLSVGKLRGLQQCATPHGAFVCLALDHRQNLRRALNPKDPRSVPPSALRDFKLEVAAALAGAASAVLLDPEYAAAQALAAGAIPGNVGLIVALEATGYGGESTARLSHILPDWSVEKSKRMGASAIKLLVYYHPHSPTAPAMEDLVLRVAQECQQHDICLMLEPLSYSLQEGISLGEEKRSVVVESARRLTPLGVDLLKAEFPLGPHDGEESVWAAACAEVTEASRTPWILLSAAVDFETYLRQVTAACQAGASGVAVGRAVWQEAVKLRGQERLDFLHTIARPRLDRLSTLCNDLARPFPECYEAKAPLDWYKSY
jgi:tagatose 1,6-diphosphate aldolase